VSTPVRPNFLRPRWRKIASDLWADKSRTGLVVASIAVGVFAIGMIITAYVILDSDINRSYAAIHPPNIVVYTDPFDQDFARSAARVPGVQSAEGRRFVDVRARRGQGAWQNLTLVGIQDFPGDINHLAPIEGTAAPGDHQVVVSQNMVVTTGFRPGDQIEVELPDASTHTLTVVGLVTDQTISKPDTQATAYAYATVQTMQTLGLGASFDRLFVTVDQGNDRAFIARLAAVIQDKVKNSGRTVYRTEERLTSEHPMINPTLAVLGLLGALGGLITVLSSSLIVNTLNALLTQQLRQIGVMKLVGARSAQVLGMYLLLVTAYGVIALALAVPLGAAAGYGLAAFTAYLEGAVLQGFRVIPAAVGVQFLIAILLPLAAGFVPVNAGARIKVQHALSNDRPPGKGRSERRLNLNARWVGWISRPLLLSLRNTFRKRGRLALTVFTLTVAGAVFIAVFNVRDSMNAVIDELMQHFQGDVTVSLRQPYRVDQVTRDLMALPGVARVEGWGGASGEIRDAADKLVTPLAIAAPPSDTQLVHPVFVAGRWLLPGDQQAMVVSDSIYKFYPRLAPGGQLFVKLPGRQKELWTVVGIYRFVAILGDPLAYANFDFVAAATHLRDQSASYRVVAAAHGAASQQALAHRIDDLLTARKYLVQNVQSGDSQRGAVTQAVGVLVIFLLIMAGLTAVVGSIGLTGTMSINVLERTREIGVMRTIGAVDRAIMQSVIVEGLVIGLVTWVLAIGLSFPISQALLNIVGQAMMGSPLTLAFTPVGILVWLGVVSGLSVVASIVPARNAARLTINEVLAYE
jgi:putative ABC transport system permease protein